METFFLCLAIGLICFALFFVLRDDVLFYRNPIVHTIGTVIGHRISSDDGSVFYMAQFEFLDENRAKKEVTDNFGAGRAKPEVGTKVKLIYPSGHPERARPPTHVLRALIYFFLVSMLVPLLARLFGFIST
ncbi:MAG: hypothetical protein ACRCU5_07235 [Rhizobiaceae bacterium]